MEEQLISLEVAKLAKEKGFDIKVWDFFEEMDGEIEQCCTPKRVNYSGIINEYETVRYYSRPTQSLLQKWLRETHNIDILITTTNGRYLRRYMAKIYVDKQWINVLGHSETYEDTFEKGLLEGLKLIK